MIETLLHFSRHPLGQIESRSQRNRTREEKPAGLWVSVGDGKDGWRAWCEAEEFGLERLAFENQITLRHDAEILRLDGALAIDAFTREYGAQPLLPNRGPYWIDWSRVADRHQGIIIAPYCWARRLDGGSPWYYGWDCASGCIWDASAIASIETRPAPARIVTLAAAE